MIVLDPMAIMAIISGISTAYGIGKDIFGGGGEVASRGAVNNSAWQKQATAVQQMINRNLTQNTIPTINREWSNRYGSGQRQEAISRATESAQFAGSNAIAQLALQQWLGQTGMEEERAWRQAQLDMQPGWGQQVASGIGQLLPYLLMNKSQVPGGAAPVFGNGPPSLPSSAEMWWLNPSSMPGNAPPPLPPSEQMRFLYGNTIF